MTVPERGSYPGGLAVGGLLAPPATGFGLGSPRRHAELLQRVSHADSTAACSHLGRPRMALVCEVGAAVVVRVGA